MNIHAYSRNVCLLITPKILTIHVEDNCTWSDPLSVKLLFCCYYYLKLLICCYTSSNIRRGIEFHLVPRSFYPSQVSIAFVEYKHSSAIDKRLHTTCYSRNKVKGSRFQRPLSDLEHPVNFASTIIYIQLNDMYPRVNFIHQTRRRNFGVSHRVKISRFTRHKTSYTKFPLRKIRIREFL